LVQVVYIYGSHLVNNMADTINERMAKLEEKVENIKANLDELVKTRLPSIEKKIEILQRYIFIAIGVAMAAQVILTLVR